MKGKSFPARFISFEGIDGCGKSTLMDGLSRWLDEAGIHSIRTREPGGTPMGESVRELLLDPAYKGMNQQAEVLLYTASRAQLVDEVIRPALEKGIWVLTDRYIDATLAYQGYGRGLDLAILRRLQDWATGGLWPDRTILLDCDLDTAMLRMRGRNSRPDRMELETRAFHQRVRDGYLALAAEEPDRILIMDASKSVEEVAEDLHAALRRASMF
ncbi:MAG: dTMP kinase [Desulfobacteraceae bacterium]|nr:dTMP kinase [Desulfobacteraceae bacterium]